MIELRLASLGKDNLDMEGANLSPAQVQMQTRMLKMAFEDNTRLSKQVQDLQKRKRDANAGNLEERADKKAKIMVMAVEDKKLPLPAASSCARRHNKHWTDYFCPADVEGVGVRLTCKTHGNWIARYEVDGLWPCEERLNQKSMSSHSDTEHGGFLVALRWLWLKHCLCTGQEAPEHVNNALLAPCCQHLLQNAHKSIKQQIHSEEQKAACAVAMSALKAQGWDASGETVKQVFKRTDLLPADLWTVVFEQLK